jgi:resuscitation-promoting factor RpfA
VNATLARRLLGTAALVIACTGGAVALADGASAATPRLDSGSPTLNAIMRCESGGRNVPNSWGGSSAQGFYQITAGTWAAHGGRQFARTAMGATFAEQTTVAQRIMHGRQGIGAWNASRHCWGR